MTWKTAISKVNGGEEIVRGYDLHDLVEKRTFVEVIYLILKGALPTMSETKMLNMILSIMIDHSVGTASTVTARTVASAGNSLYTSVAAGILALGGEQHGGALEGAAKFFQTNATASDLPALLKDLKQKKIRIPGFGHKVLTHDNRTDTLFALVKKTKLYGTYCKFAETVGIELNKISSKPLPLNMDGANAAILSDMGFDPRMIGGFFIMGRAPGLIAHVFEQMTSGEGIKRVDEGEIEYTGEQGKKV